jgi:hypothetical protein
MPPATTDERHATPLIPPTSAPAPTAPQTLPLIPLPRTTHNSGLVIGIASVSHSGRVRDIAVMSALGWVPGDRIAVDLTADALLLRRDAAAAHRVDDRGLVFLPAGSRTLLGIADNTRVVLVAIPAKDLLAVYPCTVVTALLATLHTELTTPNPDPTGDTTDPPCAASTSIARYGRHDSHVPAPRRDPTGRTMTTDADTRHAAQVLLAHLGLTVQDLLWTPPPIVSTIADYLPTVIAASGPGAQRTYSTY